MAPPEGDYFFIDKRVRKALSTELGGYLPPGSVAIKFLCPFYKKDDIFPT